MPTLVSLYTGNMRKLPYTTPEPYLQLLAGKFMDLDHCEKPKVTSKIDFSKSFATAQNSVDIARVRGYELMISRSLT